MTSTTAAHVRIYDLLIQHYSLEEMSALCLALGVDPEMIERPMEGKGARARAIVSHFFQIGRISELVLRIAAERPDQAVECNLILADLNRPLPCPYPGMVPFDAARARDFHGRSREIELALLRLRQQHFLALIGPSGSGKSSLLQAGIVPAIQTSSYFAAGYWLVRALRPGNAPVQALNAALDGAADGVLDLLSHHPPAERLLLIVDQFEETFTQAPDRAYIRGEQAEFLARLDALRKMPQCTVVIAIRADFYPELMTCRLWPIDPSQRVEIAPLRGDDLRRAIQQPAKDCGVTLEAGLLERLMADASDEPGVLPLVQETMRLLWAKMVDFTLPLSAYEDLGRADPEARSGLAVAIATKAEATIEALTESHRLIAQRTFLRLIEFVDGRDAVRRQQTVSQLQSASDDATAFQDVIGRLTANRLLTQGGDERGAGARVDISHESLLTSWPRLKALMTEFGMAERKRRWLEAKAMEWRRLGSHEAGLLDMAQLTEAGAWMQSGEARALGYSRDLRDLVTTSQRLLNPGWNGKGLAGMAVVAVGVMALAGVIWLWGEIQIEAFRGAAIIVAIVLAVLAIVLAVMLLRSDRFVGQRLSQTVARRRSVQLGAALFAGCVGMVWASLGVENAQMASYCATLAQGFRGGERGGAKLAIFGENASPYYVRLFAQALSDFGAVEAWDILPSSLDMARCAPFYTHRIVLRQSDLSQSVAYTAEGMARVALSRSRPVTEYGQLGNEPCELFRSLGRRMASELKLDNASASASSSSWPSTRLCAAFDSMREANLALNANKFTLAEQLYKRVIEIEPDYATARYGLGLAYLRQGKFDLAASVLEQARRAMPDSADVQLRLAQALWPLGNFAEAQDILSRLKTTRADIGVFRHFLVRIEISVVHRQQRQLDMAKSELVDAAALLPAIQMTRDQAIARAQLYKNEGILAFDRGDAQQAIEWFERLFAEDDVGVQVHDEEETSFYHAAGLTVLGRAQEACLAWQMYGSVLESLTVWNAHAPDEPRRRKMAQMYQAQLQCAFEETQR